MDEKYTSELKRRVQEASSLFKSGQLDKSLALCYKILENHPFQGHTLQLIGLIEINQGHVKEAIDHFERSLTELKNDPVAHHNLASAYQLLGNREKAESHDWRAIELNPDYPEPYYNLVMLTDLSQHLNIIKPIQRLMNDGNLKDREDALLHFAAGKYFHYVKDYQRAYYHFEQGNRLQEFKFNPAIFHQSTLSQIQTFNREFFSKFGKVGHKECTPIFLIGMPVCGTNPLDIILGNHSDILSLKQNTDFLVLAYQLAKVRPGNADYPQCVTALTPKSIKACGDIYLNHIPEDKRDKAILNSFPLNFNHIGLIKLLFPRAKFILCQRHPLDSCLAGYFNLLQAHYQFTHTLDDISAYYLDYLKLMQHWRGIFLEDILTIEFETLLANPKEELSKILKFLNLKDILNPDMETASDPRYHFEVNFSSHYLTQTEVLSNRLRPYIKSYSSIS